MKKIEIRFVEKCSKSGDIENYFIQKKGIFGFWKYIGYSVDMGYGGFYQLYCQNTKEELFQEVLEKYYKTCDKFVEVVEYPSLKIY